MPSVTDQGIVGYMMNTTNTKPYQMNGTRIITGSCDNMNTYFASGGGQDDGWLIFPGYKVILYRGYNYSGNSFELDNTDGDYPRAFFLSNRNRTNSFKAYYKNGSILPLIYDSRLYATITGPY